MSDLRNPVLIYAKGFLFLFCGFLAAGLVFAELPTLKIALLLAVAVWCFARFYYFAFYVIELRGSGLQIRWLDVIRQLPAAQANWQLDNSMHACRQDFQRTPGTIGDYHFSGVHNMPMHTTRRTFLTHCIQSSIAVSLANRLAAAKQPSRGAPIRVGQIGVGHAHSSKLEVYRQLPDYEVVGIVEEDENRRAQAASQGPFRDLPWMTREQLLNTPDLQVVLVETPVRDLLANAEECVRAGKHVHIDKPAGTSLPQFRRILETAEQHKLLVQMGYMYRYNPGVLLLRELLKAGALGEVFEVHAVMSKVVPPAGRTPLAQYAGGIMFELGCHIIDLVVAILGKPQEITTVAQHSSSIDDTLLDNMLAVFRYPRASATVKSSALEVEGGARRHLVVCGTEGTLHIQPLDTPAARLALSEPRDGFLQGYQDVTFPDYVRYIADAIDMAKVLRGEKSFEYSYEHDLNVQETVLKASEMPLT